MGGYGPYRGCISIALAALAPSPPHMPTRRQAHSQTGKHGHSAGQWGPVLRPHWCSEQLRVQGFSWPAPGSPAAPCQSPPPMQRFLTPLCQHTCVPGLVLRMYLSSRSTLSTRCPIGSLKVALQEMVAPRELANTVHGGFLMSPRLLEVP